MRNETKYIRKRDRKVGYNFNIGKRIKHVRHLVGWTQEELAKRCHEQPASISAWESGCVEPGAYALIGVADALGVTLEQLIGREPIDYFNISVCY